MSLTIEMLMSLPVEPLTKKEVMARYKVSEHFIQTHKIAMGGRGKPVRFDAVLVEVFFRDYYRAAELEKIDKRELAAKISREITETVAGMDRAGSPKVRPIKMRKCVDA